MDNDESPKGVILDNDESPKGVILDNDESPKGVIFKILGAVLIFLGTLNLMLLWRGGQQIDWSLGLFFFAGSVLVSVGMIRARYGSSRPINKESE